MDDLWFLLFIEEFFTLKYRCSLVPLFVLYVVVDPQGSYMFGESYICCVLVCYRVFISNKKKPEYIHFP